MALIQKKKEHEKYLVDNDIVTQDFLYECNKKVKNWSTEEKNTFIHDMEEIIKSLIIEIEKNLITSDDKVQYLMKKHYTWLELTWTSTKESYIGLAKLYQTPEFRKFYDDHHPKLLAFFVKAMKIFAERELS